MYGVLEQKPLISPTALHSELPISPQLAHHIQKTRDSVQNIMQGKDQRLLVIVGPCSIHDIGAALEYATQLKKAATHFSDKLFIIMRTYFEKPRTTIGWKGLISDPHLNNTFDIHAGLKLARKLLIHLAEMEVPAATEFLDTIVPQYLSDLISWSAVGARTAESPIYREIASGLTMPVGFKNNTDGNIRIAIDAVSTARHPHHFFSIDKNGMPAIIHTTGNHCCHIILRGSHYAPNYAEKYVKEAADLLHREKLTPRLMVDCSHGNSMKNYQNQPIVVDSIAAQLKQGSQSIFGVMIESNLVAGNQFPGKNKLLNYGQSITDGCLSWEETLPLLEKLALTVK